jgi:gamma-glutamyltranspeptidase/glutathione hydrolase
MTTAGRSRSRRQFLRESGGLAGLVLPASLQAGRAPLIEGDEITASSGVVAAIPPEAARVGARLLAAGGNAMDAAAATCVACCMMLPASTGIGGYVCSAVVLDGKTGRVWSLDANSVAPAAAHERMFDLLMLDRGSQGLNESEYGCSVRDDANIFGARAVGVPGVLGGVGALWERWGKLRWAEILAPSLELLEHGFPYGATADAIRRMEPRLRRYEPTVRHLMPDGKVPRAEDVWHRRDMDRTLRRLSTAGWRDFYEGEIGRAIADHVSAMGGVLTRDDMAAFYPRLTDPYTVTYRDATVHGPILPNGCLSSLQMLNLLGCFEPVAEDAPEYWHRFGELLKLVWRDRLRYLGDPEFTRVPIERLLSSDYAAGRAEAFRELPGRIDRSVPSPPGTSPPETLHVSAADRHGNLVAATISHGMNFGSCVTVPGTGIILGHGMCRLDPRPGRPNSVGSRKRPLNNTAPVIVRGRDRDVAAGLPGGRRIISVSAQTCQRLVDRSAGPQDVARAPRIHNEGGEPLLVTESLPREIAAALTGMGHEVKRVPSIAGGIGCAELRKRDRTLRAGGNVWAAGVS